MGKYAYQVHSTNGAALTEKVCILILWHDSVISSTQEGAGQRPSRVWVQLLQVNQPTGEVKRNQHSHAWLQRVYITNLLQHPLAPIFWRVMRLQHQ